jgi:cardiolipin synthase
MAESTDAMLLTLPNFLTVLRILAVPFFAMAVWTGRMPAACILFALAGLTDLLDGYLARRWNQRSALGAILDPAADKLLMTTAFILLAFPREPLAVQIPAWVAILAISRDVLISVVTLFAYDRWDPSRFVPSFLGKLTTTVELVAISLGLLLNAVVPGDPPAWYPYAHWMYYLVAALVFASGLHYLLRTTGSRTANP